MPTVLVLDIDRLSDADTERFRQAVPAERRARADRFHFPADRKRCLAAGVLLRYALLEHHGLRARDLVLDRNEFGKPILVNRPDLHFSLSHSGRWVACATGATEIGVDVEHTSAGTVDIAHRFAPDEHACICAAPAGERARRLVQIWTLKESYVKYPERTRATSLSPSPQPKTCSPSAEGGLEGLRAGHRPPRSPSRAHPQPDGRPYAQTPGPVLRPGRPASTVGRSSGSSLGPQQRGSLGPPERIAGKTAFHKAVSSDRSTPLSPRTSRELPVKVVKMAHMANGCRRVVVTLCCGLMMAGAGGTAHADSNDNLADPPMKCGSGLLSASGEGQSCVTDQRVDQQMVKHHSKSVDLVDFADVITPLDGLLP
ncbi:4'-phosphopantetheinyl transferase superfamily protein [Streptomyces sp. WG5]|uniref:4'-phosphopantetheinyl transferase family protein n=1 Tax=Streptomyces sp. WG5 TaxID=3417648 RepID=UPI003CE89D37